MHSYNTRFRAMNRSFSAPRDDDEYVPSHNSTSVGRRPVTRSMTRTLAPVTPLAPVSAHRVRWAPSGFTATRRPVTRSMSAASQPPAGRATQIALNARSAAISGNTHPMTLRSSRR